MSNEILSMIAAQQIEEQLPVTHLFAPDVYSREIFMPSGMLVIGHQHRTSHLNIVLEGSARVLINGLVHEITAPFIFRSGEGVRKVLYILEDCRWMTIHATQSTDIAAIEDKIIDKCAPIELVEEDLKQLFHGGAGYDAFLERQGVTEQQVQQLMHELPGVSPDENVDGSFSLSPSPIHGLGVFAKRLIKADETFLAASKSTRTILARYINHSDLVNAAMECNAPDEIRLRALRDILPGDEIITNYNQNVALVASLAQEGIT